MEQKQKVELLKKNLKKKILSGVFSTKKIKFFKEITVEEEKPQEDEID